MQVKKYFTITLLSSLAMTAYGNEVNQQIIQAQQQDNSNMDRYAIEQERQQLRNELTYQQKVSELKKKDDGYVRLTGKELRENPAILERLFLDSLIKMNKAILPSLIGIYKNVPERDESLIEWAEALLATDKSLGTASDKFSKLNKNFPNNDFIAFQYASVLFANKRYVESEKLFQQLSSSARTKRDNEVYQQYLKAIDQKSEWNFRLDGNFLNDRNLNQAAPAGTTWTLPNGGTYTYNTERQKGKGIALGLSTDKQFFLNNGQYIAFNASARGKYYWNNHKYNDLNLNAGIGYGYQDAKFGVEVRPYFSKRLYRGGLSDYGSLDSYSNTWGSSLSLNYWFMPRLRYSTYYNFSRTIYNKDANHISNGNGHFLTNALTYFTPSGQYFYGALDLGWKKAEEDTESYFRKGIRFSWGREWPYEFMSSITLGYSIVERKEALLYDIKQKDKTYFSSLSLSNKKLSYKGFMPKLTWSYTKVKSNYPIFSYNANDLMLEVEKTF
ncbi:surface lipoprotein assembly modifier [Avibacterium avium]|uniref:surface lipoprotein assembly modifier n=1 Tax=Avibacterium avium TaxID=751 RepID=UPI003BF87B17